MHQTAALLAWLVLEDFSFADGRGPAVNLSLVPVATAPGRAAAPLAARAAMLVGLAWIAAAPGLLHAALLHPAMDSAAAASALQWQVRRPAQA